MRPWEAEEEAEDCLELQPSDVLDEISLDDQEDLPDADLSDDADSYVSQPMDDDDDSSQIVTHHSGEVCAVACSPINPTLVATGGLDDRGFLWNIGEGQWAAQLLGHTDTVSSLSFSSDGQLLASAGLDSRVKIWDMTGNLKWDFEGFPAEPVDEDSDEPPKFGFEWVKWHPRGHLVLAGSNDSSVWMWNVINGASRTFLGHSGRVVCGDFTPDGTVICTGSEDGTLRIWDPNSSQKIHVVGGGGYGYHNAPVSSMAISSDSKCAFTGAVNGSVCIVNISTGKVIGSLLGDSGHSDEVTCIGLAPSMPWAATGSEDMTVIIWDLRHSLALSKLHHEGAVRCLAWIREYRYLATGCDDGLIYIWDSRSESEQPVRKYRGHSGFIESLSVSCDQNYIVTASQDGTARVFDISWLN